MKNLLFIFIILVILTTVDSSSYTNTTTFYKDKSGVQLYYETYSGYEYIDWYVSNSTAAIYYSLWQGFNLKWSDISVPIIIWLQGGPGTSSQLGCFNRVGPFYINATDKIVEN